MKLLIRELKEADVEATSLVYAEVVHPAYISYGEVTDGLASELKVFSNKAIIYFKKYLANSLTSTDSAVYVALVDKKVIGFVCLEIKPAKAGHQECWIMDLGVLKSFRRADIAKKLMQKAYSFGKKSKVKYFFLESGYTNHSSHSLFKKEGFKPLNIVFVKEAISK